DSLSSSPVIVDLMSLCRALANPADRLAWMSVLRAPWCGLSLKDLHTIGTTGDFPAYTPIKSVLENRDFHAELSPAGRLRVEHLSCAMHRAELARDRLPLRTWIESLWLALGGPRTTIQLDMLHDAERFFQLLEQADRENHGLNLSWLESKLEKLYVQAENPDSKIQVMTLHKAKGLEFDWVIIPSLGKTTRANNKPLLLWDDHSAHSGERGFLLAADDHSADDEPTLYNWLKVQRSNKEVLETTRLLYVGVTRAVQRLYLTTGLKFDPRKEEFREPSNRSLLGCIWPLYKEQMAARESIAEETEQGTSEQASALLRLDEKSILTMKPVIIEANLDKLESGANIPELSLNTVDRYVGTVVHLALEQISRRDAVPDQVTPMDSARWRAALANHGLHGEALDLALRRVDESVACVLADPDGRWVLSPDNRAGASELSITIADAEGKVSDLVIDRTFVDTLSGTRWVIDYKNSKPEEGEPLGDFSLKEAAIYTDQLSRYKTALQTLYEEPVKCALYFTALGRFHELSI
ncbi:MAG: ATP-dependent helicase/nuclease subunit A, partial [Cryomorphaceae bacterium]